MHTNKLILGTVQMGLSYGINNSFGQIGIEDSLEILDVAFKGGIRCLDTAELYGSAHEVIGQYHKSHPEQIFEVITKLPHELNGNIGEKINLFINKMNLTKLKALLFHSFKDYKANVDLVSELNIYKKVGKIEHIGVSVYTNLELESVIDDENIDIIQLPFNLFDNVNQRKYLLVKAKDKGKIIHTRSTFLQGLFFKSLESDNPIVKSLKKELTYIKNLSDSYKLTLQKIALNYCLQQSEIDNVLIGVDSTSHLKQNLIDADSTLSDEVLDKINAIFIQNTQLLNPSLWTQ